MPDIEELFAERVEDLVSRFEAGVDHDEWATRRYPKRMRKPAGRIRELPALVFQRGPIKLILDPIGHDVPGAEGLVDIYLMPDFDPQVSIYFEDGDWRIHFNLPPDSRGPRSDAVDRPMNVDIESINRVLNSIADHAVLEI